MSRLLACARVQEAEARRRRGAATCRHGMSRDSEKKKEERTRSERRAIKVAPSRKLLVFYGRTQKRKEKQSAEGCLFSDLDYSTSQGVTEDLRLGEDFGRAGPFPRAGANGSLWGLRAPRGAVRRGHGVFSATDFFGVRRCVSSSSGVSRQTHGTFSATHFSRFPFLGGFSARVPVCRGRAPPISVALPRVFARPFLALSDRTRRRPVVVRLCRRPPFETYLLAARPGLLDRPFQLPPLRMPPDLEVHPPFAVSLLTIQALPAGRVF